MVETCGNYIPDPRIGSTLSVVIFLIDGVVDDVKIFPVTRLAREHVRDFIEIPGDENDWTNKLDEDGNWIFTHKGLNEQIIIALREIQS